MFGIHRYLTQCIFFSDFEECFWEEDGSESFKRSIRHQVKMVPQKMPTGIHIKTVKGKLELSKAESQCERKAVLAFLNLQPKVLEYLCCFAKIVFYAGVTFEERDLLMFGIHRYLTQCIFFSDFQECCWEEDGSESFKRSIRHEVKMVPPKMSSGVHIKTVKGELELSKAEWEWERKAALAFLNLQPKVLQYLCCSAKRVFYAGVTSEERDLLMFGIHRYLTQCIFFSDFEDVVGRKMGRKALSDRFRIKLKLFTKNAVWCSN
ncbi:hypothetical protein CDAR_564461 [Caerostris darwini]|uniref:Uncharacterized protein n=1 Tax=Caerostris darwini TaxID=1538125 RepID=A0AAV4TJW4_9ARAC|nr:hypothetical protein CDAR_564461 [Caerostris darwini]